MGYKLNYPIVIKDDNVGAIYLSNNYTTSQRTKHIDIRQPFVHWVYRRWDYKILFKRSEDNDAYLYEEYDWGIIQQTCKRKNVEKVGHENIYLNIMGRMLKYVLNHGVLCAVCYSYGTSRYIWCNVVGSVAE
jgi:hypothetical protein